jgi:hypothetical protein
LANHKSFTSSMNIPINEEYDDLPTLYWIPKLHKNPYREMYIAGSYTCSTEELFITTTNLLSAVKEGLQLYFDKATSIHVATSIKCGSWKSLKTFCTVLILILEDTKGVINFIYPNIWLFYFTLPFLMKIKSPFKRNYSHCILHYKNGKQRYKFIVLGHELTYFVKHETKVRQKVLHRKWSHQYIGVPYR